MSQVFKSSNEVTGKYLLSIYTLYLYNSVNNHFFDKYLQNSYYLSQIVLGTGDKKWMWRITRAKTLAISFFFFLMNDHFIQLIKLFTFSYTCPNFFPIALPSPIPTHSHSIFPHIVHAHEYSIHTPWLAPSPSSPIISLPHPLWSLSVCSLYPCLWFYFPHLFVLFIRFHL